MKNPSPQLIAVYMAAIVSAFILLVVIAASYIGFNWITYIGVGIISFLGTYFLLYTLIETFIYHKIKVIYKSIFDLKTSKDNKGINMKSDVMTDVNKYVLSWIETNKQEVDQLRKLEVFRREFLGNVSHELKTPLFSIQGYIHTLIDSDLQDEDINMLYLEKASRSVDRLCTIVDDLEAISKLESGELVLEVRTFDMHDLVKDVFDMSEMRAKEKEISLSFKQDSNKVWNVEADKERIRQVVTNLIVNSIKYGKQNGHTQVGFYDMDENILIEVNDDGIGVEQKNLPRLFERFYRVDKSRSRDQGGTGLGLAIVKHIIEAHHQAINVRSTSGIGSTFGFTLKKA
jgi:two-component system phosphate regulon sensor histidine kinase PhoR